MVNEYMLEIFDNFKIKDLSYISTQNVSENPWQT